MGLGLRQGCGGARRRRRWPELPKRSAAHPALHASTSMSGSPCSSDGHQHASTVPPCARGVGHDVQQLLRPRDVRLPGGERRERAGHPLRPAPPAAGAVEGHHRAARPLPVRRGSRPSRRRHPQASPAARRPPRRLLLAARCLIRTANKAGGCCISSIRIAHTPGVERGNELAHAAHDLPRPSAATQKWCSEMVIFGPFCNRFTKSPRRRSRTNVRNMFIMHRLNTTSHHLLGPAARASGSSSTTLMTPPTSSA